MSLDIAAVVNLHSEGLAARPSLISAWRAVENSIRAGNTSELVLMLDQPDDPTRELASEWTKRGARVVESNEGDLGAARNAAVQETNATSIAFLDADDLWGPSWLTDAAHAAGESVGDGPHVFHPEVNIIFGDHHSLLFHQPSNSASFSRARLRLHNMWTALAFARRDVFLEFPYPRNQLDSGFGYEDWSWNLAILDAGGRHHVIADTCHFIRRSDDHSLLGQSHGALRTPYPRDGRPTTATPPDEISALSPVDPDLPATHAMAPHDLSPEILEQIRLVATIEPEVEKTLSHSGHPRVIAQNRNDHVTATQRALESIGQLAHSEPELSPRELVDRCPEFAALSRTERDRAVAELLLAYTAEHGSLPSDTSGCIGDALMAYPQLRPR